MSPIDGISDANKIPVIGHIRLGKPKAKGPGQATEYFELRDEDGCAPVKEIYGEKPTKLKIMFPSNTLEDFASQYKKRYSQSQAWTCIGTSGRTATGTCKRKVDTSTGDFANADTKQYIIQEGLDCLGEECPEFMVKPARCKNVMHLLVLLPDVAGFGVFQINTSSIHNMIAVNSYARLLKGMFGRCYGIPIEMSRVWKEVTPPGQTKKKILVLQFNITESLTSLAQKQVASPFRALLCAPEQDQTPDDLYGAEPEDKGTETIDVTPTPVTAATATAAPTTEPAKKGPGRPKKEKPEPVHPLDTDPAPPPSKKDDGLDRQPSELWRQFVQQAQVMGYDMGGILVVLPKALEMRFSTNTDIFRAFILALQDDAKKKSAAFKAPPSADEFRSAVPTPTPTPTPGRIVTPEFTAVKDKAKAAGISKEAFVQMMNSLPSSKDLMYSKDVAALEKLVDAALASRHVQDTGLDF